jgi:hypothetical protein
VTVDPAIPERCGDPIAEGFPTDDLGSCHLPKGHDGMHTPLPVLWQMAGFMDGPWHPESRASQRIREVITAQAEQEGRTPQDIVRDLEARRPIQRK